MYMADREGFELFFYGFAALSLTKSTAFRWSEATISKRVRKNKNGVVRRFCPDIRAVSSPPHGLRTYEAPQRAY